MHKKLQSLAIFLSLFVSVGYAATIRVPQDQRTIQAGIDVAEEGDTVLVAADDYSGEGNRNISFHGKAITVTSESGAQNTIIHPQRNRGFTFAQGETEASVLSGFTIKNGVADWSGGIYCSGASPTITNCVIEKNTGKANGAGIHCTGASPTIVNCIITENNGGGINCLNSSSPMVINSIIVNNTSLGIYSDSVSSVSIRNTIVRGNSGGQITKNDGTLVIYSNIEDSFDDIGNIDADPMFVDAENGDYRLQPDSPCIDAGNPVSRYSDVDGSRNDMGAYGGPEGGNWEGINHSEIDELQSPIIHQIDLNLNAGINLFSLPLRPESPITASRLATDLAATIVVRAVDGIFQAYVSAGPIGEDFQLEAGTGVIINLLEAKNYSLTGRPWGTPVPAAPTPPITGAWAFAIVGKVDGSVPAGGHLRLTTPRTGESLVVPISSSGEFTTAFVDMSQKNVVNVGDVILLQLIGAGGVPWTETKRHLISSEHITRAYLLTRFSASPEATQLLQNYPNPFNPETWLPYHLATDAEVTISIYNVHGTLIRRLDLGYQRAHYYMGVV